MKFQFFIFSGILLGLVASEESSNFIVGGENATIADYPYMAGVLNFGLPSCGGSIITARSVLTAAHCFLTTIPGTVSIFVGSSQRRGESGRSYRALRLIIHPDYIYEANPTFVLQADIAIIRTVSRIQFGELVKPIPLGRDFVPANSEVILTGWGLTGDSLLRDRPDQLQMLKMTSISNLLCTLLHRGTDGEGLITDEKICVVADNDRGACGGDSGGPITWRGAVVGVVSWGLRPCGLSPTVFIRVEHHLPWIQQNL